MTLVSGTRLGPYEILSPLGAGGMGEVYRARDTRLERTVAIKVLPSHLSQNPEFRQRFEREAKTISSLSHPHICSLYDIGHQDGTDYLVMEYLEGETLTERLAKGPLPTEQVLRYGIRPPTLWTSRTGRGSRTVSDLPDDKQVALTLLDLLPRHNSRVVSIGGRDGSLPCLADND